MALQPVDFNAPNAPELFEESLHRIGFGVLANTPLAMEMFDELYAKWYEFFQSPVRYDFPFDRKTHAGYVAPNLSEIAKGNKLRDLKEFFHYYTWADCPEHLRDLTQKAYTEMTKLARILLGWIQNTCPENLCNNFSEPLPEMIVNSQRHLLRILHYPPLTDNEEPNALRAAAHGDINFLTILPAATTRGLQILQHNGEWLDVPCAREYIIINTGDMLQEATDGYYPSTLHRVMNPHGEERFKPRISSPLFLHPRDEVVLSPRHTAQSYRQQRYKELGLSEAQA